MFASLFGRKVEKIELKTLLTQFAAWKPFKRELESASRVGDRVDEENRAGGNNNFLSSSSSPRVEEFLELRKRSVGIRKIELVSI